MATLTAKRRGMSSVIQFSVFTANRIGRLNDLVNSLHLKNIHVLALSVLDTTDAAIIRFVVDDPEHARETLHKEEFPFTESELLVVEMESATDLSRLMSALLEAELNINYLYSFIPHPNGKSLLAMRVDDQEVGEDILTRHQFRVLKQADISR